MLTRSCLPVDVRFPPKATEALLCSEMTRWARTEVTPRSFDHLVGGSKQYCRHVKAERLGGL
jgi:hypothetical protein